MRFYRCFFIGGPDLASLHATHMADGGRPITAADLGTLFADRCLVDKTRDAKDAASRADAHRDQRDPGDEPDRVEDLLTASIAATPRETADGDPPPYGRRLVDSWRPADDSYFGGGGAFPEIPVVQFPSAIGWDAKGTPEKAKGRGVSSTQGTSQAVPPSPASLDLDFDQLQTIHARMMLRLGPDLDDPASVPHRENLRRAKDVASRRTTKEWDTLVSFCAKRRRKGQSDAGARRGDTKRRHRQVPARLAPERAGGGPRRLPRPTDGHGAVPDQRGSRRRRTRRGDRRRTRLGSVVGHRAGCAVSKVVRAVQRPRAREEGGRVRRRIGRGATVVRAISS